jgi:hypothetical protein
MSKSQRKAPRLALKICGVLIAIACVDGVFSPKVREVRIDSGDRRSRGWVIRIPEGTVPGREHVIAMSRAAGIPPEWHKAPFTAPSYPDQGRYFQYSRIAWWAEHEPALGQILLERFAEYYRHPPPESGYPMGSQFLFMLESDPRGPGYVLSKSKTAWYDEEALQYLLDELEYRPSPGGIVESMLEARRR